MGDEGDEELATCSGADWGGASCDQGVCSVPEGGDELEDGADWSG